MPQSEEPNLQNFSATVTNRLATEICGPVIQPGSHWVWLSVGMYFASNFLPGDYRSYGIYLGFWTAWDIFADQAKEALAFMANPIYVLTVFLCLRKSHRLALVFAFLGLILTCGFVGLHFSYRFQHLEAGCLIWIASSQLIFCDVVWEVWLEYRKRMAQVDQQEPLGESPAAQEKVYHERKNAATLSFLNFLRELRRWFIP